MFKPKVLLMGPAKVGKTTLANFLADATENIGAEYRPTKGVRIVEFESSNVDVKGRPVGAEVELWDCGATGNAESCWPIFAKDANGIVFVFNQEFRPAPDTTPSKATSEAAAQEKLLEKLYNNFVRQEGVRDSQCLVVNQVKPVKDDDDDVDAAFGKSSAKHEVMLPDRMRGIPFVDARLDADAETVKTEFNAFLARVLLVMSENREREEQNIIDRR